MKPIKFKIPKAILLVLFTILVLSAITSFVIGFYIWFSYPELTGIQIFLKYWYVWIFCIVEISAIVYIAKDLNLKN